MMLTLLNAIPHQWGLLLGVTAIASRGPSPADAFAYAPNFITKIIQDGSGLEPRGLLDVSGGDAPVAGENEDEAHAATAAASVMSAEEIRSERERIDSRPICTRFPPEPNGYLHLGHAKAVSFNFAVARMFENGRCNMRLDDTNPSKEGQEYVDSILEDVRWIQSGLEPPGEASEEGGREGGRGGPWFGPVRKTSDSFDLLYDCAVALIRSGDAYVESLSAEEMREYRGTLTEPGRESPYRDRSVEENLNMFDRMRAGEYRDGEHILRAKIDMASPNINLRDPALYRIKHESHQETGDKWCIYPMYDFSHPVADAVEGITHSLCTLEFEDHRPLYDWTLEKLLPSGLISCQPRQIEFSRLNVKSTVLSKRKLIQLVEGKHVSGWDDPRMPTLSGMRRRGVPPSALRLFCERVGISKADSNIDFGVLEDCVREEMDKSSARAFAILNPLRVTVSNWQGSTLEDFDVPRHPKVEEMGDRTVPFGKRLYIERSDFFDLDGPEGQASGNRAPRGFKRLLPGGRVRLKYAYVISCDEVVRDPDTKEPVELKCTLYPETRAGVTPEGEKRVKGIIQWVEASTAVKCKVNQYDRLFTKDDPGKESGDFLSDINADSLEVIDTVVVEPSVALGAMFQLAAMRQASKTEGSDRVYPSELSYQFERSGYFALDASATTESLVFNRVVTLRDTWKGGSDAPRRQTGQRNRGGGGASGKPAKKNGAKRGNADPPEDVLRVAIRAATILEAGPHPDAESLIFCKVDCGDEDGEPRTVVAGLAGLIAFEDLLGRKIACVTNLKPSKMRGIESSAMLLAATDGGDGEKEVVDLLDVPADVPNGELLNFEGKSPSDPDPMMKSKGALKAFERAKACLRANGNGEAGYENGGSSHRLMSSAGPVTTSLKSAVIR